MNEHHSNRQVIVAAVSIALGILAGGLVWLVPAVSVPVGAGIAVAGLALAVCGLWRGHS